MLPLRQLTRRKPGDTRQVHILTTRPAATLPAADVIYRMTSRWREDHYFRYGRAHFALDALLLRYHRRGPRPAGLEPANKTAAAAVNPRETLPLPRCTSRNSPLCAAPPPAPAP